MKTAFIHLRAVFAYNQAMNKGVIMLMMGVGSTIGGIIPYLLGDNDLLSLWPILGSIVGGIIGIWLGVKISRSM
jgi:uncharacterized membrane protein YfcA